MFAHSLRRRWTSTTHRLANANRYAIDAAIAAAIAVPMSVPFFTAEPGEVTATGFVLTAATVVPLIWRRRFPFVMAVVVACFTTLVALHDRPGQAIHYAGVVAVYTLADLGRPWQRWTFLWVIVLAVPPATMWLKHDDPNAAMFTILLPLAAFLLGTVVRTNRERAEALAGYAREVERGRASEAERAALAERARIARDMHGILAHAVSMMVAQAEAGPIVVRSDPERAERAFETIADAGRDAAVQLRRVLGLLDAAPQRLELARQPGVSDIQSLAEQVTFSGMRVDVWHSGEVQALPPDHDTAAYRVVQESLTNVLKHAVAATGIAVRLDWWARGLMVTVTDDGNGVATLEAGNGRRGRGLIDVRERVASCGGRAEAGPAPGGGFRVMAWLPFPGRKRDNTVDEPEVVESVAR